MQRKPSSTKYSLFLAAFTAVLLATSTTAFGAARMVLVNMDKPGEGFNDPTPAAPVGGNMGATVGEQRRIAVQYALDIWGAALDINVDIRVQARFAPLPCNPVSGVLGVAGAIQATHDFPGAEFPNTWYLIALANKRAGYDLNPDVDDIRVTLNSSYGGTNPDGSPCFSGFTWYYGLDTNHTSNQTNMVAVVLHELGHGLGFSSLVNLESGAKFRDLDDIFSKYIFDTTVGKRWDQMTDEERQASAINTRRVVWDGPNVKAAVSTALSPGIPILTVNSPGSIGGAYVVDGADFGPHLSSPPVTGNVILADDGEGVVTDACSPLRNAEVVRGNITLVDRGSCPFTVKMKNAENAGAIGVIVANNVPNLFPFRMSGDDPTIAIPSVMVLLADGDRIKAAIKSEAVNATLGVDPAVFSGADGSGRALLYTPNPTEPNASVLHWDTVAFPDQVMEPFISDDLHTIKEPRDLTLSLMRDVGWFPRGNVNTVVSVSAANFRAELASEAIAAAFGTRLATTVAAATDTPDCRFCLTTELGGTRVLVKDSAGTERPAPLFFVSPSQVNYQIPPGTAVGQATVTVTSGDGTVSVGTPQISAVAPGLFTANSDGQGVPAAIAVRFKAVGEPGSEPVAQYDSAQGKFVPLPLDLGEDLGEATDQVFLVLFGTGLRHRRDPSSVSVKIGGVDVPVLFAGPQPQLTGLDQINLQMPRSLIGRGEVDVVLVVEGKTANTVKINIW